MNIFDQEIMARTAVGEARGEDAPGMLAVMWTGVNRYTRKRWFSGQSIAGTFLKHCQYSCWLHSDPNYGLVTNITAEISIFSHALELAEQVLKGLIPDPTFGATHYYSDSINAPDWVKDAEFTIKIGRHSFYKNVP